MRALRRFAFRRLALTLCALALAVPHHAVAARADGLVAVICGASGAYEIALPGGEPEPMDAPPLCCLAPAALALAPGPPAHLPDPPPERRAEPAARTSANAGLARLIANRSRAPPLRA